MTQNHNIERVGRSIYQNSVIQPLSAQELSMMHDLKTKKINEKSSGGGMASARRFSTVVSPAASVASSSCAGMVALATVAWEQKVIRDFWAWVSRKVREV